MKHIIIPIILLSLFLGACKKGALDPKHYTSGITVISSQLSDKLEIQFAGSARRDSLNAGGKSQTILELHDADLIAGVRAGFKVYRAGTNELVADTSFLLQKGTQQTFNVIASKDLGLNGFLKGTGVPQDSIRIRLRFIDNTTAKKFGTLQWEFYQYDLNPPFYDVSENVSIITTLHSGQYGNDLYIPYYYSDHQNLTHVVARLKDPATGQYLEWFPGFPLFDTPISPGNFTSDGAEFKNGAYIFLTATLDGDSNGYNLTFTGKGL